MRFRDRKSVLVASALLALLIACQSDEPIEKETEPVSSPIVYERDRAGDSESALAVNLDEAHYWPDFPAFLWMYRGPEVTAANLEELRRYGIDAVNVEAHQSSTEVAEARFYYYVGHASGKGTLGLRDDDYADSLASGAEFPIRPRCFNDASVLAELRSHLARSYDDHQGPGALAVSIDDEMSVTRYIGPCDYCYGHECLRLFRRWLRKRYGDTRRLSDAWGMRIESFDEVKPPTTTESFEANDGLEIRDVNFVPWSDHRQFMERSFCAVVNRLIREGQELWPTVPVGFLGGQPPSAYGGYDWWELTREARLLEAYDIGGTGMLARSFAHPECRFLETLYLDKATPGQIALGLSQRLVRLDDGVILWSAESCFEDRDVERPSVQLQALKSLLPTLRDVRPLLQGVTRDWGRVAVYYSQDSVRAGWIVDTSGAWQTWPNRLSSFEEKHSSSLKARSGWESLLTDLQVPYRHIASQEVLRGSLVRDPPRVLILPRVLSLSQREARALTGYVRNGGCLIADSHLGLFDSNLRAHAMPPLDRLFDIRRDPIRRRLPDLAGQHALMSAHGLPVAEGVIEKEGPSSQDVLIEGDREDEPGRTLYLNLDIASYSEFRDEAGTESLRNYLEKVFDERDATVEPRVTLGEGALETDSLAVYRYRKGTDRFVLLCRRGLWDEAREDEDPWGPPLKVTLSLDSEGELLNLVTGEVSSSSLEHQWTMSANGFLALQIRRSP